MPSFNLRRKKVLQHRARPSPIPGTTRHPTQAWTDPWLGHLTRPGDKRIKLFFLRCWWRGQISSSACSRKVFQFRLRFASKAEAYQSSSSFLAPRLSHKIRLSWKNFPDTCTLAYLSPPSATKKKSFTTLAPGPAAPCRSFRRGGVASCPSATTNPPPSPSWPTRCQSIRRCPSGKRALPSRTFLSLLPRGVNVIKHFTDVSYAFP